MKQDLFNLNDEMYVVKSSRSYVVTPYLPEKLRPLMDIAYNLWWVWNSEALELFRRMDRDLWEESYHNPIRMLGVISQDRLAELEQDDSFVAHLDRIRQELDRYMQMPTWYQRSFPERKDTQIAYFSTEFGLHESVPIYSGGLGILSGDHLKSASDMGLPLVGVGLLYRFGYFKQYLNVDGWQQEEYIQNHFYRMPLQRMKDKNGKPLKIHVEHPSGNVYAQIWKIQVGRVPLYLLDSDIDENRPEDREITSQLYGGDREMRIRQETLLGIGGVRALKALGIAPTVFHLNEGHSAFLVLERTRLYMESHKLSFGEAREMVKNTSVFTTHTPVPAGNEVFAQDLVERYLEPTYKRLGLQYNEFIELGKVDPIDPNENFGLTVLALRMSNYANGVSRLHGTISRNMWKDIWPNVPRTEVPITSITNGIHTSTWISYEMAGLFDRYIGPEWKDEPADQSIWGRVSQIPDAELWRSHERRRERLVSFARSRLRAQLIRRGASPTEVAYADEVLDPEALTIAFARRFAAYKRGNLIFRDIERLKAILAQKDRPVQIIIAGKAHPQDNRGKELIRQIIHMTRDVDFRRRVVFLEDYDMNVAHYLVQGADIWLNNPRRPAEASGTSGMKAAANGVLNLSILDGWWCEGYNGENGWIIGSGEEYSNTEYQDEVESKAVYDILEKDVVPLYYRRGTDGLPREWIRKMKRSMATICPAFNTNRMIEEYTTKFYMNADSDYRCLTADSFEIARQRSSWKEQLTRNWGGISVIEVNDDLPGEVTIGGAFDVRAKVSLGRIAPDDIMVQLYWGYLDSKNRMIESVISEMQQVECVSEGVYVFKGTVTGDRVGHCAYVIRVMPKDRSTGSAMYVPGLITWQ